MLTPLNRHRTAQTRTKTTFWRVFTLYRFAQTVIIDNTIVQLSTTTSSATSPATRDLKNMFTHLFTKHLA